jgi:hypothetical protein
MTPHEHDKTGSFCRRPFEVYADGDPLGRSDGDELVRRLRNLQWPEVSAEVRQRCWKELTSRLSGNAPAAESASEPQGDRNPYWRNEFTPRRRPISSGSGALHERWTGARGLSNPLGARHLRPRTAQLAFASTARMPGARLALR